MKYWNIYHIRQIWLHLNFNYFLIYRHFSITKHFGTIVEMIAAVERHFEDVLETPFRDGILLLGERWKTSMEGRHNDPKILWYYWTIFINQDEKFLPCPYIYLRKLNITSVFMQSWWSKAHFGKVDLCVPVGMLVNSQE